MRTLVILGTLLMALNAASSVLGQDEKPAPSSPCRCVNNDRSCALGTETTVLAFGYLNGGECTEAVCTQIAQRSGAVEFCGDSYQFGDRVVTFTPR